MSVAPRVEETALEGVLLLTPVRFEDDRGWFREVYNRPVFADILGTPTDFVQDNESRSVEGTLRGIHYQLGASAQGKLVRAIEGEVHDVVVDLRRSSPTLGSWIGLDLRAEEGTLLWIPPGFGHAFLARTDGARLGYKTTAPYDPAMARTIRWNDRDLAIDWPLDGRSPIQSVSDASAPEFATAELFA